MDRCLFIKNGFVKIPALVILSIGVLVVLISIGIGGGGSEKEKATIKGKEEDALLVKNISTSTSDVISEVTPVVEGEQEINNEENKEELLGPYKVIKVVDGDTLTIDINNQAIVVRLIGVNTPETVDPRKLVECFGVEASQKAHELLDGRRVYIEKDSSQGEYDKYNRTLVYVFLEDGTHFNKRMIEDGYAHEYTYNLPYKYQIEFKNGEKRARETERGLWALDACLAPVTPAQQTPVIAPMPAPIPTSIPAPTLTPTPTQTMQSEQTSNYICSSNIYNCDDFMTHAEAQKVFEMCGGVLKDVHGLDRDKDGLACETLP